MSRAPAEVVRSRGELRRRRVATVPGSPSATRRGLAFGVRREDPELRAAPTKYLTHLRLGSSWNRQVVKYFGDAALEILRQAREAAAGG